jgi:L-Ala-D/L-Glu epimerase
MPHESDKSGATLARRLAASAESWPIAGAFTIARGSKREAQVVVARIEAGGCTGQGECVPYPRYGESVESTLAAIGTCSGAIAEGASRQDLLTLLPAGAARNALDCALWDLEAKLSGVPAAKRAGLAPLRPVETAFTISLAAP